MVRNGLIKKFLRDVLLSKGQVLSIIVLSALGVLVFSGLDGAWRNIDVSVNEYFEEQRLADFWIVTAGSDKSIERKIAQVKGVKDVQSRFSCEMETTLPGNPRLILHAVRDRVRINIPFLVSGNMLWGNDYKGCLLDVRFADANGLTPGDHVTLKLGERRYSFIVRGLVISPEYIFAAKDIIPEPKSYGFIYTHISVFSGMPRNEICVLLSENADVDQVKAGIEDELPRVFIRDRRAHNSTQMIRNEVSQFKSLSVVFPVMFFAVSALIVMTTMTRIVDKQRTQMGLLKALGYRKNRIMRHYMSFGFFPALIGSAVGMMIGRNTLPQFLWSILDDLYQLPETRTAVLSEAAFAVCALSVLLTCTICYYSCRRSISETSAALLRPKPPKTGSRILLERIPAVWRHFSFSAKMIVRNLIRGKMRTIMALMGVLSCTALIITAFGLMDSINNVIDTYYEDTLRYDLRAELDATAGGVDKYRRRIAADKTEGVMEKAVSISTDEDSRTVLLTVFEEGQELLSLSMPAVNALQYGAKHNELVYRASGDSFTSRGGGLQHIVKRDDNGVIISEKLAEVMGLSVGDSIEIKLPGNEESDEVVITDLAPIQIGQGLYMSEDAWERLERGAFVPTALLIRNPADGYVEYLDDLDEVTEIKSLLSLKEKTKAGIESMSSISVLMAAFALTLAFVVLYNMGILNFIERIREFATLKVLGFYQRETRSLIVRENAIVTLLGILSGIYPGIWLSELVMLSSEPEDMVFTAVVKPVSILTACIITLVFSLLIQCFLTRKVRGIVMVEALKSVE